MKTTAQKLCELVNKRYLVFTSRGNSSIKLALEILKMRNKHKKVLIQDQGGWLTYPEFILKMKFEKVELRTDYGIIIPSDLEQYKNEILLINSMPAYAFLEDMEFVYGVSRQNNIFVINDVSGSIGTEEAKYGDIILGSFGDAKPINLGEGGFIATDDEGIYKELTELNVFRPEDEFLDSLDKKLDLLDDRLMQFDVVRFQTLDDLHLFNIIHPESRGINVIIKYELESERNEITEYCKNQELEFTVCPRYIRVNCKAISIEIKRFKTSDLIFDIEKEVDVTTNQDEKEEE